MPRKNNALTREDLENFGSLITLKEHPERCLGDLMQFAGHGTYDPSYGQVPVTAEEAQQHNVAFDEAKIDGLDLCPVGKGGMFYVTGPFVSGLGVVDTPAITTFIGTKVSETMQHNGVNVEFTRKGMKFRGRKREDSDCIFFKRVA